MVNEGFRGRSRARLASDAVPPGQFVEHRFQLTVANVATIELEAPR